MNDSETRTQAQITFASHTQSLRSILFTFPFCLVTSTKILSILFNDQGCVAHGK
jgi:hypothetical protein